MIEHFRKMVQQLEDLLEDDPAAWWMLIVLDVLAFYLWWQFRVWAELLR